MINISTSVCSQFGVKLMILRNADSLVLLLSMR